MNELLRRILNLPPQASSVARDIDSLHYFVIGVTMAGALLVAGLAGYWLLRYRVRDGRWVGTFGAPEARRDGGFPGTSKRLEWVIIAGLLTLFVMWWVIGFQQYVRIRAAPDDALEIYVTAKKWMWTFAYPDGRRSNSKLYVPANRPVKLILSSRDVIHSFYVPAFRIKQDVVPGRTNTAWFEAKRPGRYALLCAEYCGTGHSRMRGEVVALAPDDYASRSIDDPPRGESPAEHSTKPGSLAAQGKRLAAQKGCLRCHTVDGTPHIGPTWARVFGRRVELRSGRSVRVDEAYLTQSMMDPLAKVRAGFKPVMPSYRGRLDAGQAAAIVEYIKQLKDLPASKHELPLPPAGSTIQLPGKREKR